MSQVKWVGSNSTNQPPNRRLGAGARRGSTAQKTASAADQDSAYATKFKCDAHLIEYYGGIGTKNPRCPMCTMERQYDDARAELLATQNELKMATNQLSKLKVQVDLQGAIRAAIEVLDDNDYEWLKLQMYQYKIDKSVSLKPTHGKLEGGKRLKRGEKMPPNGFMSLPKRGDPTAHLATSFGGLAIAEYLDEAISTTGSAQAMGIMLKAWWKVLPGGVE